MKFKFKIQQYQTDAVNSIARVFVGQPFLDHVKYMRDLGVKNEQAQSMLFDIEGIFEKEDIGFENAKITLSDETLLENINRIQSENNIRLSDKLFKQLGRCALDIEMETGTGKTYVYIKSIFELHKKYGWRKFIIVVPSIAIREGVKKSFEMTADHFMEYYGKKARFFIYNSARLQELDTFASSASINVMIINAQAFNASGNVARRIDMVLDDFAGRRPIDVIAKNRPIIILDEPQKLGGGKTQEGLKRFNPLFMVSFSATHVKQNNLIYALDALDSYNQKLVKKIEVKGFELKNLRGTSGYLYLSQIVLSKDKPPMAKIEFEINYSKGISRETRILKKGDNLYYLSAGKGMPELEQYKDNFVISDINPFKNTVTFLNGNEIEVGRIAGGTGDVAIRRVQIRETILSHFEKEEKNFYKGIKTLSLFFVDEVSKYKSYNASGEEVNGEYADIFEREYAAILNEKLNLIGTPYIKYLQGLDGKKAHNGYFSIDKKTGRSANPSIIGRGEDKGLSDDISAYNLILKNKERLLGFEEPTRFIFSHSALREGWDNPNVFQICTLKKSDSTVTKRQEVGRGMRLCVNSEGDRIDAGTPNISVHDVNKLTVIASDSYADFVSGLQAEIKSELYERPTNVTQEYFIGKYVKDAEGNAVLLDKGLAKKIYLYLCNNDYTDENDNVTPAYRDALAAGTPAPFPAELQPYAASIQTLVGSVFSGELPKDMITNASQTMVQNKLNTNFERREFQELWKRINHRYTYDVTFDSAELIKKATRYLDEKLFVTQLKYVTTTGAQKRQMEAEALERGESFACSNTETKELKNVISHVKYDLVGKLSLGTTLTRRTIVAILQGIAAKTFYCYKANPEEFINKAINLINEQKAALTVEHVAYTQTDDTYDVNIFTAEKQKAEFDKAFKAYKHIQDYVFTDGTAERSVERRFAEDLENAKEVAVYAKLPRGFQIPTPVGNYSPDWAIAFNDDSGVRHIYFIAETKGTLESMQLRPIEQAKMRCARRLFNELSTSKVKYHEVTSYQELLDVMSNV
ncbi:MAG: DEAD/DEAH box helicase family protein [Christensenellaceae bacterium]|jgi:type III restriction enzyme|nr:DEAD/DEAH box helicase family protein [Christensenellaceae bacterium]